MKGPTLAVLPDGPEGGIEILPEPATLPLSPPLGPGQLAAMARTVSGLLFRVVESQRPGEHDSLCACRLCVVARGLELALSSLIAAVEGKPA